MFYSKECEFAIRAMTFLASHQDRASFATEIAAQENIPEHLVMRVLAILRGSKIIVESSETPGGYSLAKPAEEIKLHDIKAAIDGTSDLEECAVGLGPCSDDVPCPLHESFKPMRESWKNYLNTTTLSDLAQSLKEKREQLSSN